MTSGRSNLVYYVGFCVIYDRIVAKGKSKKLVPIAVCNKLLKQQAFAITKSRLLYEEKIVSKLS